MMNNKEPIIVDQRKTLAFSPQNNFLSVQQRQKDPFVPIERSNEYRFLQSSPRSKSPSSPSNRHHQIETNGFDSPNKHNHTRNIQNLKYKTEVCRNFFGDGCFCEFGKNCNFIHFRDKPESIALGSIHALKMLGLSHRVPGINSSQTQRKKKRLQIFRSLGEM
eukprot:Anaeramoba_flamelloidesa1073298_62.p1 GENE.a1073298_62~~a1073298_62.p1  ORF type:complete len:163 (-),score=32.82 a1073298_62:97-585(-)